MLGIIARNAKTVAVAGAVAAVTAAVMSGAPALAGAASSVSAAPSPVIVAGFKNGPVDVTGSGLHTVATMHVPAGSWAIFAKAWVLNLSSSYVEPDCRLVAGGASDSSRPLIEPNGQSASAATLAFNVIHKFTSAGTAKVECNAFGTDIQINMIKVTAIKAGKLTNGALS
jgi:hypothetical protein